MRAAIRRRDGVAVGLDEAVRLTETDGRPGDGPFKGAGLALTFGAAGESGGDGLKLADAVGQGVGQTTGEVKQGLGRGGVGDPVRRAGPFDLDAAEQIGLGPRHAEQAGGLEGRAHAEDFVVRLEPDQGALLLRRLDLQDGTKDVAAREGLLPLKPVAPDGDVQMFRQGVHDRNADAVQTARGFIGLARKLAARVEDCHHHLQRRLAGMFRVGIDRNAAPVVAHRQIALGVQVYGDQFGVAGHGLVHRIIEDFGEQMVQSAFVGAADIHAGAFADGFQPLQHFDRRSGIAGGGRRSRRGLNSGRRRRGDHRGRSLRLHRRSGLRRLLRRLGFASFGFVVKSEEVGGHSHSLRRFGAGSGRPAKPVEQAARARAADRRLRRASEWPASATKAGWRGSAARFPTG